MLTRFRPRLGFHGQQTVRRLFSCSLNSVASLPKDLNRPGCFGLEGLHRAEDWALIADACVNRCTALAARIREHGKSANPSVRVLHDFDTLSDELCRVLDTAELCRNVHSDPTFCEAAERVYLKVSATVQELNADYDLYRPLAELSRAVDEPARAVGLAEEDIHMVKSLTLDFEQGGITLCPEKKSRLIELQDRFIRLSSKYSANSSGPPEYIEMPTNKLQSLPKKLRSGLVTLRNKPHSVRVPIDTHSVQPLLRHIRDSSAREYLYRASFQSQAKRILPILDDILSVRHEMASILGNKSYAHMQFQGRLAESPEAVVDFLRNLADLASSKAVQERNKLEDLKSRFEPTTARLPLQGWDRPYYISRAKAARLGTLSSDITHYMPLAACLEGIAVVMKETFGVSLTREEADHVEIWDPSVQKLRIQDCDTEKLLGYIYLDLSPRPSKYSHSAHFSLRCGRDPGDGKPYQTPVVALVCSFEKRGDDAQQLLSLDEYETLWHEMGHAFHSLMSRTKYQHLSGTRVSTDLVEIPSHVFEHFARDPRVLTRIARHYKTGELLPSRILNTLSATRNDFSAIDLQTQALLAAADLRFHWNDPPVGRTTDVFHELHDKITVFPHDTGVANHSTFNHLVGYGAGYYTYIFARVLSAQIWAELFSADPFSRAAGNTFRNKLLVHGAARNPRQLVKDLLKRSPTCDAFLQSLEIPHGREQIELPISE